MNAAVDHGPRWSRRRWCLTIFAVTLAQVAALLALSQRTPPPPRATRSEPDIRVLDPNGSRYTGALPGTDPTLFALINRRSFSGRGWMQFDQAEHELRDWQDEPRWLTLDARQFGADFRRLAANSGADRLAIQDKPAPRPTVPPVASLPVRGATSWELSPELRARPLLSALELPAWMHSDVLGRTVLQLVVNAAGDVLSARVLKTCGVGAADAFAVQTFERARFEPLPRADRAAPPALGTAMISWITRPPETNGAPATSRAP
jgi:TonB family protein